MARNSDKFFRFSLSVLSLATQSRAIRNRYVIISCFVFSVMTIIMGRKEWRENFLLLLISNARKDNKALEWDTSAPFPLLLSISRNSTKIKLGSRFMSFDSVALFFFFIDSCAAWALGEKKEPEPKKKWNYNKLALVQSEEKSTQQNRKKWTLLA